MMRKLGKLWLWIVYAFLFLPIFVVIAYSFNAAKYTCLLYTSPSPRD